MTGCGAAEAFAAPSGDAPAAEEDASSSSAVYTVVGAFVAAGVAVLVALVLCLKRKGHHHYARPKDEGGTVGPGAIFVAVVAGADFAFDVLALGELRGGLYGAGLGAMVVSLGVNAAVVVAVVRGSIRRGTLDVETANELSVLMTLVLLFSVTNLDTLVLLPWVLPRRKTVVKTPSKAPEGRTSVVEVERSHDFLGFPSKTLMLVTLLSVVFENIPQLVVTYLNADERFLERGKPIPVVIVISMVTSGGMMLYSAVRKVLSACLGVALLDRGSSEQQAAATGGDSNGAKVAPALPIEEGGEEPATTKIDESTEKASVVEEGDDGELQKQ